MATRNDGLNVPAKNFFNSFQQVGLGHRELRLGAQFEIIPARSFDPAASSAPSTRSRMAISPFSCSLEPLMIAQTALRLSAYFNCAFIPEEPR